MTEHAVGPLVVFEDADARIHASESGLLAALEPWFANQNYRAYDARGYRLELVPTRPSSSGRPCPGSTSTTATPASCASSWLLRRPRPDELAALPRRWLIEQGVPASDAPGLEKLLLQGLDAQAAAAAPRRVARPR